MRKDYCLLKKEYAGHVIESLGVSKTKLAYQSGLSVMSINRALKGERISTATAYGLLHGINKFSSEKIAFFQIFEKKESK